MTLKFLPPIIVGYIASKREKLHRHHKPATPPLNTIRQESGEIIRLSTVEPETHDYPIHLTSSPVESETLLETPSPTPMDTVSPVSTPDETPGSPIPTSGLPELSAASLPTIPYEAAVFVTLKKSNSVPVDISKIESIVEDVVGQDNKTVVETEDAIQDVEDVIQDIKKIMPELTVISQDVNTVIVEMRSGEIDKKDIEEAVRDVKEVGKEVVDVVNHTKNLFTIGAYFLPFVIWIMHRILK